MKGVLLLIVFLFSTSLYSNFDIEEYKNYLLKHKDMSVDDLLNEYPAGYFLLEAPTNFLQAEYADRINRIFELTDYEHELIKKHGFMVSERLSYYTFINAFWDIYKKDLPVYISSDAILHALHYSFGKILVELEEYVLVEYLRGAITKMKAHLENVNTNNAPEIYIKAVNDLDIYLTIAEKLLKGKSTCTFEGNTEEVDKIMLMIENKQYEIYPLFSDSNRPIDFSQFTPRGHYTRSGNLTRYFQTMMWLGRIEIQFYNPKNVTVFKQSEADLQRMAICAALLTEASFESGASEDFETIEEVLMFLLGRQDNINLWEVKSALDELSLTAFDISKPDLWEKFRKRILEFNSANQLYNSQILFSGPNDPNQVIPPVAFLLFGQRPIIDGFITANTTYDNILYQDKKVKRMIPSTKDILFSLGNDAAVQLLMDDLEEFPYSSNLAALRYLIDSYDDEFWKSSAYTNWVNSIRSLNPPPNRENLPLFMQTAAWWQKTMNTQLASWAELRHDFLLYAKQPYTHSLVCSYPHGYVEPIPQFYGNIQSFFFKLIEMLNSEACKNVSSSYIRNLAKHWIETMETLKQLSDKILYGLEFSEEENDFICSTLRYSPPCDGSEFAPGLGWYANLYYGFSESDLYIYTHDEDYKGNESDKFIVADVHTIPTDSTGGLVGWVLHAGTGKINLAVITAPTVDGGSRAYVGPVFSYYEFLSDNFKRLTNEEWREMNGETPAYRPDFTNLYLAKDDGNKPEGDMTSLFTIVLNVEDTNEPQNKINHSCTPNPFTSSTVISFAIPKMYDMKNVELSIYDVNGNKIKTLLNSLIPAHNYSMVWDGTDSNGRSLAAGTYIYSIIIGELVQSGKINFVK